MASYFLIIFILLFPVNVLADDFFSHHETGWYWFDDPKDDLKKSKDDSQGQIKTISPEGQVLLARQKIKNALDQAIIDPTPENVEKEIILENQLSERANVFANIRQQVVLNHPELNYSLIHPTNNTALQVYHEKESLKKIEVIKDYAKHSGLFFFYRSTCPYCRRFAPIVKHFSETYHINILPITMDGIPLPEFPQSRTNSGQSMQFNVTVEPSLYAVDPNTGKYFPVAFGLTSESELFERLYNILTRYKDSL